MTAFARATRLTKYGTLVLELRSVNHRYLDCQFKLPNTLNQLEPVLREILKQRISRGKIDCNLTLRGQAEEAGELSLNQSRLAQVLQLCDLVNTRAHSLRPATTLDILAFPGVCNSTDPEQDGLIEQATQLMNEALSSFLENREREGATLAALIEQRLCAIEQELTAVRKALPTLKQLQRERLQNKLAELDVDLNQDRLEQELLYLAQKSDADEELDRLDAHIAQVRQSLSQNTPCGRRLDFLMQELNREANTLSAKATASSVTHSAVELKVLIEQMREQVQNIE
ncbi:MAG: YicC family protein [Gammaproteobacteria bacterium]|nr:MAG: YicC family protein [Gammaproteobacteria bacterium]